MKQKADLRGLALITLAISFLFFVMGFLFPLLQTGYGLGPITLKNDTVYLHTSFRYFFNQGELFVGFLLLFFTIIFPALKYIFLLLTLLGRKIPRHQYMSTVLEIINKWSMLDVFVVAVLILNMKFDSTLIRSSLGHGTTLFAISVVLLMLCSFITRKMITAPGQTGK
jgi:paraquat-inducible protein A